MSKPKQTVAAFSKSIAACASTATAYGACISATMNDVHKGVCEKEFLAFKDCVQTSMKRKW
ncbi:hypothetical protein BGZ74_009789 [Mortierella antarctica]|uniref:IMS import disulfide relay-system CHCH-CHCH-like Cx9C domain-containing protein n=1 Tax=Podila minutissima TaxID=64525 RepID=A0A9P5VK89_9FUNG|nr:hypothetical protein BGZ74_009789 [Mortierella antarctica]KAF9328841.1 hypothetical protein BG006_008028 [Podila minutissima]